MRIALSPTERSNKWSYLGITCSLMMMKFSPMSESTDSILSHMTDEQISHANRACIWLCLDSLCLGLALRLPAAPQERLIRDSCEVLFATTSQNSLIRETMASFRRRCGTLEITLHDTLGLGHSIQVAQLSECPEVQPFSPKPSHKR